MQAKLKVMASNTRARVDIPGNVAALPGDGAVHVMAIKQVR